MTKLEAQELEDISKTSQDLAVQIALMLAKYPSPPMPDFPLESKYEDPNNLADIIDDTLEKVDEEDKEYNSKEGTVSKYKEEISSPAISEEEAKKACLKWKDQYEVVIGVSWGKLPFDLQQKWMSYHCDLHISSSNIS